LHPLGLWSCLPLIPPPRRGQAPARIPFVTVSREVIQFLLWSLVVLVAMILFPPLTLRLGQEL